MHAERSWWRRPELAARFVGDLLAAEFTALRPGVRIPAHPWPLDFRLDETGLGCDSLDRLKLAVALGEAIHLGQSGIGDTLGRDTAFGAWVALTMRSLDAYGRELTFKTSGSTGNPKWCVHDIDDLALEIAFLVTQFTGRRRIVSVVPSHHIYGLLFTVMLPAALGIDVLDARAASPIGLVAQLRPGDLIIGFPTFWDAFARGGATGPADVEGTSSTAPLRAESARAAVAAGLARLVEIYGSSETAGIGVRDEPSAPFGLMPHWRRGATDDELLRRTGSGTEIACAVPDRLAWTDERHLRPAGRREGAVQVGGHNVFPARVRAVLLEHPAVADAAVRLMAPGEGDRLKAFVVPHDPGADPAVLADELTEFVDARLAAPERPRAFTFGPSLPAGALGKAADWPVPAPRPRVTR